jgi:peptidoglycan/LPS O-acetylase OafA/YrhL
MVIPMAYLSILDGVRTIAVLLVVACHLLFQVHGGKSPGFYDLNAMGHLGVAIFFVHTSLVLLGSLDRHGSALMPFYVRRVFRIYPLSITIVLLIALIQLAWPDPIDIGRLLSNLFLVQNLTGDPVYTGPLWSLPHEVQMYLFLPFLYFVIRRTKHSVVWCALIYFTSVVLAALDPDNLARFHTNGVTASLIRYAPCFTAGALAFALSARAPKTLHPAWLTTAIALGMTSIPLLVSAGSQETPLMWTFCLVIAIMIPLSRELTCQPIVRTTKVVATYSYGVYITHLLALSAIDGMMPGPPIVQWIAMLILLVGLPYICYHGIEKRGVALGARLAARCGKRSSLDAERRAAAGEAR